MKNMWLQFNSVFILTLLSGLYIIDTDPHPNNMCRSLSVSVFLFLWALYPSEIVPYLSIQKPQLILYITFKTINSLNWSRLRTFGILKLNRHSFQIFTSTWRYFHFPSSETALSVGREVFPEFMARRRWVVHRGCNMKFKSIISSSILSNVLLFW